MIKRQKNINVLLKNYNESIETSEWNQKILFGCFALKMLYFIIRKSQKIISRYIIVFAK